MNNGLNGIIGIPLALVGIFLLIKFDPQLFEIIRYAGVSIGIIMLVSGLIYAHKKEKEMPIIA